MNIINMTPHEVTILKRDNTLLTAIPASGETIRLKTSTVQEIEIDGIPISRTEFGKPEVVYNGESKELPEEDVNTIYIVSQLVKNALPHRLDLFVPAEVVRDEKGQIVGCYSLGR